MKPTQDIHHLTFLRHGESEGNVKRLFQGQVDYPLTDFGRRQAHALARRWRGEGMVFDKIIASPLSRARETAEIVAAALGLSIETAPVWMEQDFGEMSKRSIPEVVRDPNQLKFFAPYNRAGRTGESASQTLVRASQAVHSLIDQPPGRYLVVSHGALLNRAIYSILGIALHPSVEGPGFAFRNTAFTTLTYTRERHIWEVAGVNDCRHSKSASRQTGGAQSQTTANQQTSKPVVSGAEPSRISNRQSAINNYHITFVRHGQSEGNANGVWQGQADYPLTELGRAQARALAERWAREGIHFDAAIASPLSRARNTAEIIAQSLDVPLEIDPIWLERDNGRYAGTAPEERDPPEPPYLLLHQPVGETGETLWEIYLRGGQAIQTLLRRPPGRYLVVSHGGILNRALYAVLGIAPLANY
ncbi:MAG: 2-carboxy-D-arabinitol-1-phosphatase, partial [Anaerolineales bacterium]